jgi:CBS domain-containing protein
MPSVPARPAPDAPRAEKDHFLRLMFFQARRPDSPPAAAPGASAVSPGYHPLSATFLQPDDHCVLPLRTSPVQLSHNSPAVEAMTDLRHVVPVTIAPGASIDDANRTMIASGVRALFVVEQGNTEMLGLVSSADILGERPLQLVQQRGLQRHEIQVRDVMTTRERLGMLELVDVLHARVGDVVETLLQAGRQHVVVSDRQRDGGRQLCGLFSLTRIATQLGVTLEAAEISQTFAEIESAIGG